MALTANVEQVIAVGRSQLGYSESPRGSNRTKPPDWLISLFGQWGWSWGGGWSNPDPMHFEVMSTPAHVRQLVAMCVNL